MIKFMHKQFNSLDAQQQLSRLPKQAMWILHITDTHLYADPKGELLGVNTLESMVSVLDTALKNLPQRPDLLLVTGDLVHDASEEGYRNFAQAVLSTGLPVYCIPGNHDNVTVLEQTLQPLGIQVSGYHEFDHWQLFCMDSTIPDKEGGRLRQQDLQQLTQTLEQNSKPALIIMHHQPSPVGSAWIDSMAIENENELMAAIKDHQQVKSILFGHVHQTVDTQSNNVRLLATPSTCIQFTPNRDNFHIDTRPPAYRVLALSADGNIDTCLLELEEHIASVDLTAAGY